MKMFKNTILIIFFVLLLIAALSCSQPAQTITSTVTSTATITSTPDTITIKPTPTSTPSPTPITTTVQPTPSQNNQADNKTFFTTTIISGYTTTYSTDGTSKQTPVYQDLYFDMNLLGYYTSKDAIFVPRIQTITNQDDWFIRSQIQGSFLKSWTFNWGYTLNPSIKTTEPVTVTFTIYDKEIFEKNYYLSPANLLFHDLKGDINPSTSGIQCKRLIYQEHTVIFPNDYVFLIRTNNAAAVSDFWIKVGTESNITTK
jgi:hypothetical protein